MLNELDVDRPAAPHSEHELAAPGSCPTDVAPAERDLPPEVYSQQDQAGDGHMDSDTHDLPFHPFANAFPLIEGEEYAAFCEDIATNGQLEPIVLHEGMILDGRNRYRALRELGITPVTVEYEGESPLEFVLSMNMYRRQLTVAQRSMIAAEIIYRSATAEAEPLEDTQGAPALRPGLGLAQAATLLGISERSISSAGRVARKGTDELLDAVKAGKVKISAAEYIAQLDEDAQREVCAQGSKAMREMARTIREQRQASARKDQADNPAETEQETITPDEVREPLVHQDTLSTPPVEGTTAALFYFASSARKTGASAQETAEQICRELANTPGAGVETDAIVYATEVMAIVRERMVQIALNETLGGSQYA